MQLSDFEQTILSHVSGRRYKPIKPKEIAKKLNLSADDTGELKRVIKRLVKIGKLSYGKNHLVGLPAKSDSSRVIGLFRRMSGGFGFVRPDGTQRSDGKTKDIYISSKNAGDASSGDTVLLRMSKRRGRGGQPEGEVVDVLERETHRFVGTYFEQGGGGLVRVDGTPFTQPILVGDPGAKGARLDDKVVLEMVRFPSHVHQGEGVIVEVLGQRGAPGVDTLSIIHEFNLPGDFADDAMETARKEAEKFDESIGRGRVDLTDQTVLTIDPQDARDFDDAISLEKLDGGHWRLGVHIADVSHFVRVKSPLDREARDRATSVYLPDRVIPMLPEIVSNNLASLQPDRVRYCLTATIEFTADGAPVATDVQKTAIKSKRRFTYEEVDQFLENRKAWTKKLKPNIHALLSHMHELAMILRQRRLKHGALELSMPEVKVDLDKNGRVSGAHIVEHTESHQVIEEFMLAANEAVARTLHERSLLFLRRIHAAPDPRKLKILTEFIRELGFQTESLESRFEIQRLLNEVRDLPHEHAVNYAVLRSMQKAVYSPQVEGHFALSSDCYCHFTSPIRRYPDLTVHRLLTALIRGKPPQQNADELFSLGEHCSNREQRAESAERELTKVKLLTYLSDRIGEEMEAIITGVEEFGLFVQGVEIPAEGLIHVSALTDDYYRYDRAAHSLAGNRAGNSYRLGDKVRVAVARVDVDRRQLDFRLLGRVKRTSVSRRSGVSRKGSSAAPTQRTPKTTPAKKSTAVKAKKKTKQVPKKKKKLVKKSSKSGRRRAR